MNILIRFFICLICAGLILSNLFCVNFTESAPRGIWKINRNIGEIQGGEWIVIKAPDALLFGLAKKRKYLGIKRLLKQVKAVAGDHVYIDNEGMRINGEEVGLRLQVDGRGKKLPIFFMNRKLGENEIIVWGETDRSFDSRYFGPLDLKWVESKVTFLSLY